jgi:hypothetical protein
MSHYIKHVFGHVEVYENSTNRFILSADTEGEAVHELGLYLADQYRNQLNIA